MTKQGMYLVFAGLNPDLVTETLGLKPTREVLKKGRGDEGRLEWILDSDADPKSRSGSQHFASIFGKLDPIWGRVISIAATCDVYVNWFVEIGDEGAPEMNIDVSVIRKLSELGAAIDIDLF